MRVELSDVVTPTRVRMTDDGYLVADAPVARTGVQLYRGAELGIEKPFVRVLRPESEVFNDESMHSYAFRPMTNDHPGEMVTADNWREFAIGQTGGEVVRDGEQVRVSLVMMDGAAIQDYENGKRELSMGYTADIEILDEEAETEDGIKYDAIQRNLRMNHLALVKRGRAGNARIGDGRTPPESTPGNEGGQSMAEQLRKVMVDGLSVETTDQGAEALAKLMKERDEARQELTDANEAHTTELNDRDKTLAEKDGEIEKLKKQIDDQDIDALVNARAELVSTAKSIHDADYSGMDEGEIKKTAVAAVLGDEAVADKSDAYIDVRFDILAEDADDDQDDDRSGGDRVRQAMRDSQEKRKKGGTHEVDDVDSAYEDQLEYLRTAHMGSQQ